MTIDTFVQIVALIIAIFALVPRARQLEVRIHIGGWEIIAGLAYFCITVYLLFYDTFLKLGWAKKWCWGDVHGITTGFVSFWITILFVGFMLWRFRAKTLPRKSISKFQELAEGFLQREEYSDLISLLERYWDALIKIEHNQYSFPKIRHWLERYVLKNSPKNDYEKWLKSLSNEELQAMIDDEEYVIKTTPPKQSKFKYVLRKFICATALGIANRLPEYKFTSNTAGDLIRAIVSNNGFVEALSRRKPYFAIKILETDHFPRKDMFFESFMDSLLLNPQSVLYSEVANVINSSNHEDKELRTANRLLYYLLNDAKKAYELSAWRLGNGVLRLLEKHASFPEKDICNLPVIDFGDGDVEIERSPVNLAISFFEIMVTRALYQGVEWHMDLYYFPHFVKSIVRNYKPHPSADLTKEYPTRYSKFLYRIFKAYTEWVLALNRLPIPRRANAVLDNTSNFHQNENIPKSSLIALGFSLEYLLPSENISENFKEYLMDIVFRFYFELRKNPATDDYAEVLLSILTGKGMFDRHGLREMTKEYYERLHRNYHFWAIRYGKDFLEA